MFPYYSRAPNPIQAALQTSQSLNALQAQHIANLMQQQQAQVNPQMLQAQLQQAQATPGLTRAQTAKTLEATKFIPEQYKIMGENAANRAAMLAHSATRSWHASQLSQALRYMSPAARATWIAKNQGAYNQMLTNLGNAVLNTGEPTTTLTHPPGGEPPAPHTPIAPTQQRGAAPTPAAPVQNLLDTVPSIPTGLPTEPGAAPREGLTNPYTFSNDPNVINQVQRANQMAANQALTTSATRKQLEGAVQVDQFMNTPQFEQQVQHAAIFAGAAGRGKAALAALSQKNPVAYEDYLSLQTQTMPLLLNRIKTLESMGATNEQRTELHGFYTQALKALTSNPKQFLIQMNNLRTAIHNVSDAVKASAQPLFSISRALPATEMPPGITAPSNATEGGQQVTPQAQVKIPTFTGTKAQGRQKFRTWYAQQTPTVRAQVRQQLAHRRAS